MKKDSKKNNAMLFGRVKILVFSALLCAISGVMKLIAPSMDVLRISLENFPIIFSGITMGPFMGGMVGIAADLIGCLFRGYAVNPFITLASMCVGIIAGIVYKFSKRTRIAILIPTFTAHFLGNVIIKTIVLSQMFGMKFNILLIERGITYFLTAIVEYVILTVLLNNKAIKSGLKRAIGYEL